MRWIAGIAFFALLTTGAQAQTSSISSPVEMAFKKATTVGDLLVLCSVPANSKYAKEASNFCLGVVEGAYGVYKELLKGARVRRIVCPPPGTTRTAGAQVFIEWAKANPKFHQNAAVDGLFRAWAAKYPC